MKKFIVSFIFCLLFVLIGNGINAKAALEKDICYKALSQHKYTTAKRA